MRYRTIGLVLVLATTLALAGCNGGPDGTVTPVTTTDGATATDGTRTPSPTTNPDVDYPPGVTESGLTNETALFAADWAALNETGFTAQSWFNRSAGGEGVALRRQGSIEAGGQVGLLSSEQRTANGTITTDVWRNATFGLNRLTERGFEDGNTTRYRRQDRIGVLQQNPLIGGAPASIIALGNYTVERVEGAGADARITLTADTVNESRASQVSANVSRYTGELVVDSSGRIHSVDVTVETSGDPGGTFAVDYDLQGTGDATVERPDWFETGLAQAPQVNLSAEFVDGQYVELTNGGPDALEAGWAVQLQTLAGGVSTRLPSSVESGETVYLYYPNGTRQLQVNTTVPTDARNISGVRAVTVTEVSAATGETYPVARAFLVDRSVERSG